MYKLYKKALTLLNVQGIYIANAILLLHQLDQNSCILNEVNDINKSISFNSIFTPESNSFIYHKLLPF